MLSAGNTKSCRPGPKQQTHLEGRRVSAGIGEGQEAVARLLWQLYHLSIGLVTYVTHKRDILLQVHLQGQQAAMPLVGTHHSSVHSLQLPVHKFATHHTHSTHAAANMTLLESISDLGL